MLLSPKERNYLIYYHVIDFDAVILFPQKKSVYIFVSPIRPISLAILLNAFISLQLL
jgi:hypothetical protein